MTEFEKALIHRDGVSKEDASRQKNEARSAIYDILAEGGSYDEVEDLLADEYGLEMDYIMDLI